MKKILTLSLLLGVMIFLLAPKISAQPDELTIWVSPGPEEDWTVRAGKAFEEETGIAINVETEEHINQPERLGLDGPAGEGADIVVFPHDNLGSAAEQGIVEPIENYLPDGYAEENFVEVANTALNYEDNLYGLPYSYESLALVYNKDIIEQPPETFAELKEVAHEHTDPSQDEYGYLFDMANFYHAYAYIGGFGGYVFAEDEPGSYDINDIGLANEEAIEAAEFLNSFRQEGLVPEGTDDDVVEGLFMEGNAAMIMDGPWNVYDYSDAGVNVGTATMPELPNGEYPETFVGVIGYFVSSFSDYGEEAAEFVKFMTNEEWSMDHHQELDLIVPHREVMDSEVMQENEVLRGFATQARRGTPMPNIPEMSQVWDPAANGLEFIYTNRASAEQAMPMVVEQIEQGIRQMQ